MNVERINKRLAGRIDQPSRLRRADLPIESRDYYRKILHVVNTTAVFITTDLARLIINQSCRMDEHVLRNKRYMGTASNFEQSLAATSV